MLSVLQDLCSAKTCISLFIWGKWGMWKLVTCGNQLSLSTMQVPGKELRSLGHRLGVNCVHPLSHLAGPVGTFNYVTHHPQQSLVLMDTLTHAPERTSVQRLEAHPGLENQGGITRIRAEEMYKVNSKGLG